MMWYNLEASASYTYCDLIIIICLFSKSQGYSHIFEITEYTYGSISASYPQLLHYVVIVGGVTLQYIALLSYIPWDRYDWIQL